MSTTSPGWVSLTDPRYRYLEFRGDARVKAGWTRGGTRKGTGPGLGDNGEEELEDEIRGIRDREVEAPEPERAAAAERLGRRKVVLVEVVDGSSGRRPCSASSLISSSCACVEVRRFE